MRRGQDLSLAVVLLCLCAAPTISGARVELPRGKYGAEDPRGDLAEFLTSQQLVVRGTLLEMAAVERGQIGGCGRGPSGPYRAWDISIHVDSVIVGIAEDTTVTITTVHQGMYPSQTFLPGAEVIAWGFRNCVDGWRMYGDAAVVQDDGVIVGGQVSGDRLFLRNGRSRVTATYERLVSRMATLESITSTGALNGSAGLVVTRIVSVTPMPEGLSCRLDSTWTVFGTGTSNSTTVTFAWQNGCLYEVSPGDHLLLPAADLGSKPVRSCPYALIIRDNFVRAFGVPLDQLQRAVRLSEGRVVVRNYLEEK